MGREKRISLDARRSPTSAATVADSALIFCKIIAAIQQINTAIEED